MGSVETDMAKKKSEGGFKILEAESEKAPNRLDLLLAVGNTAVRAGKFDLAIQTLNRLLGQTEKGSKQGDIYLRLGVTYHSKGDTNGAIQVFMTPPETLPYYTHIQPTP